LFRQLDEICNEKTIFSTNTSSLSISKLASATKRQDKIVGIHFFNPVHVLNLVEIVMGEKTSEETLNTAKSFINSLKKELLIIEDSPGFVVNRLLLPMINEAAYILSEGKLNEHEIDKAMKLGANHPMGPLALADLIGIDLCFRILKNLSNNNTQYTPCPLFEKMIDANELGRKTGKGFYKY
jgi:3-hydroxybutyryl-CoA dehydrogenase